MQGGGKGNPRIIMVPFLYKGGWGSFQGELRHLCQHSIIRCMGPRRTCGSYLPSWECYRLKVGLDVYVGGTISHGHQKIKMVWQCGKERGERDREMVRVS
jgi:hypothetical protein